jgi:hypothetical protein
MESQHVKSINTDERSTKRIKFASAKERSKRASADVYRSYKRKVGATSAATREEFVHNPHGNERANKKHRAHHLLIDGQSRSAVLKLSSEDDKNASDAELEIEVSTTFASELDVALDRNASEIFGKFHRKIWVLVRSLPEILHNADKIIDLLMTYFLSPASHPERPSDLGEKEPSSTREEFVVNHATTDILHLLTVLARDLRHEIHGFLHTKILPRIIQDLLNRPPPPPESGKQPIPLNVTVVEAAFRTLSYIFRYDSELLVADMEAMRKYYGATLANRRELVRRLAAETFAPLIRKIKSQSVGQRHLRRVLRALAATGDQLVTNSLKRTQSDAVDGISQLIFQLVRGVPGRLHSQGHQTLRFLLEFCTGRSVGSKKEEKQNNSRLVVSVASSLLDRVCFHVDGGNISTVTDELVTSMKASLVSFSSDGNADGGSDSLFQPVMNMLSLMAQVASFRSGFRIQNLNDEHVKGMFNSMETLYSNKCYAAIPFHLRSEVLSLSCSIWTALQKKNNASDRLERCLRGVFRSDSDMGSKNIESIRSQASVLSKNLLPYLTERSAINTTGLAILTAAARIAEHDQASSLLIAFSVAAKRLDDDASAEESVGEMPGNSLFFSQFGTCYEVPATDKGLLLSNCLAKVEDETLTRDFVARLGVALRCAPFLTRLSRDNETEMDSQGHYKNTTKWIIGVLNFLEGESKNIAQGVKSEDIVILKSLALEAFANLSLESLSCSAESSAVEKMMLQTKPIAEQLLLSDSASLWAMRGVASFIKVMSKLNHHFNDKIDEVFDALVPNLRSPSHSLRLHTLEILASYPEKAFVTDHADLDFDGDLDEEPSYHPSENGSQKKKGPVGLCDIIKTMLNLETVPVRLTNERMLLSLVSRVDVLGRTGKLPVIYAEAAANHMLGLFYVKFTPMWPVIARSLVSLATAHEDIVWPTLEAKLVAVMQRPSKLRDVEGDVSEDEDIVSCDDHHAACIKWQESIGKDISVFRGSNLCIEDGEVPRHLTTDEESVMESVWSVAEQGQQLLAKHSRVIVPVFLSFLHNQYYAFHSGDPDARELNLHEHVDTESFDRETLDKYALQRRLTCFLKVFAAIDGPQQMVKHKLLERTFRSFLNHQESLIVQLALSSLLKYKPRYLLPYSEIVRDMLQKGRLRTALLKFEEEIESGKVDDTHRELLFPLVSRILFGRVSAKGAKSSKDSPAAKRAAILSFLSVMCREDNELFSFIYLMTRCFIPRNKAMKDIESYSTDDHDEVMTMLLSVKSEDLALLPSAVIEGFLHLLETVLAHLGHRIISFVPQFTSITLAICKFVAVTQKVDGDDSASKKMPLDDMESAKSNRNGPIRTLCFQRLSEIFGKFGSSMDLTSFAGPLWSALGGSVEMLPEMVVKCEKAPSLLTLLETMSTDSHMIKLIEMHDRAVHAVVKCIAETSFSSVMNATLTFVENLLTVNDHDSKSIGLPLIRKHIPLLMEQFTSRLNNKSTQPAQPGAAKGSKLANAVSKLRQTTWRRELHILCRVSELITAEEGHRLKDKSSVLENLCALLLPFLEPGRMTSDEDKLNVLGILKGTITQLDPTSMRSIFATLSNTLAPIKSKPGIKSLLVRHSIASLIDIISNVEPQLRDVAKKLMKLTAIHSKRIDEIDFDTVIPELNALGKTGDTCDWVSLCGKTDVNPSLLTPVISSCFHFIYDEDGVISRTAFNALKAVVTVAASKVGTGNKVNENGGGECQIVKDWIRLIESSVVPLARTGLQSRDASIRRYYVLLIREISKCFHDCPSPNLCGDLSPLYNDDNPDLDFFVNITHVQIHRRARAFQRLRKVLIESAGENSKHSFTSQSLSNILLPLAMHPAYECKTNAEETFVVEAIATTGAISRLLSWSKYNNTLWTILRLFDRYPEQERYLVGMMCAIIDGFSFELIVKDSEGVEDEGCHTKTAVWGALERRIIPKIEGLLTKEKVDRNGSRVKTIRPTIVLALLKLFQKFPQSFFETKLHRVLTVMCDALRSKESDARDVARNTLAKIVVAMDLKYLADVIREISITLNEGYKLHVRSAVIHTILNELSTVYKPPSPETLDDSPPSCFDKCTAALMDVIQDDLFGEANERRESKDTNVRYVKEAGGSKSVHSIEMICRMITFKPCDASKGSPTRSAVHCVVSPLLERLRLPDVETATIRKIREILARVVIGLSHNPSIRADQLFPFVYATVQPFIGLQTVSAILEQEDDDDDMKDVDRPIHVSGGQKAKDTKSKSSKGVVVEWRPSTLKTSGSSRAALDGKEKERRELLKVRDGVSAPKLTGTGRHGWMDDSQGLNNPASINAVLFGLNLLNSCLKTLKLDEGNDLASMMDPFIPVLTACVCHCRDTDVALVALKCLMSFLRFNLPSISSCSKSLGTQTLTFLTSSGSSLNQNHDLTQACFKTLTYLINIDKKLDDGDNGKRDPQETKENNGENALAASGAMPLNSEQMKVLISLLQVSVAESDQHNPALGLIKAILSRRYTSPEFYDLMEAMLKLNVRSQKASLRQQSAVIFIRYLLDYPMGEERFEQHLKQVVANINYEYQEGRMSALNLMSLVIERLPEELLEKQSQLLFLPLVLQFVNDDSKECREAVSKCLVLLLTRSSTEVLQSLHDYTVRWSKHSGPLRIASLQVFGIFVESCSGFIKGNGHASFWIQRLQELLQETHAEWEIPYFSLKCVEKLGQNFEPELSQQAELWTGIIERLIDSHPWVKLASSRNLQQFFVTGISDDVLNDNPGMLFEITRNFCFQLNVNEEEQSEELSDLAIKTLTLVLPIMKERPHLCFAKDSKHVEEGRDPVYWLMRRLSEIAKPKGRKRRMAVFKCFAAFTARHNEIVAPHMDLALEPLHRASVEASNELDNPSVYHKKDPGSEEVTTESSLARDVLQLLEETSSTPEVFLKAYASVKTRARDKKEQRKVESKAEAVNDPMAAAQRKIQKQQREKGRKKRRVEDRRQERGAVKKRRSVGS